MCEGKFERGNPVVYGQLFTMFCRRYTTYNNS